MSWTAAEIQAIVEWDQVNWYRALQFLERRLPKTDQKLRCLELGGRRGGLSLWLAAQGHQVICSDLTSPESIAKTMHQEFGLTDRIQYEAINALEIPYENHFDIIVFKSVLGGASRSGQDHHKPMVLASIHKALKPGGHLLFMENLEASALHRFLRKRFVRWGNEWNYLKHQEIDRLMADFSEYEHQSFGYLGAFGRSEGQRQLFGKIDHLIEKLIPASSRYILSLCAKK